MTAGNGNAAGLAIPAETAVPAPHRGSQEPTDEAIDGYLNAMAQFWNPVCLASELTNEPRMVQLLGRQLAVVRLNGDPVAFDDVCCHLGAALSRGDVLGGERLRCRYHGWTYDCTGACVDIPGRATDEIPPGARVRTYKTTERYGIVWVSLVDQPRFDIPPFPQYDDPDFRIPPTVRQVPHWRTSAPRSVIAGLDDSHFPWVHSGTLADVSEPRFPQRRGDAVTVENGLLCSEVEIEMLNSPESGGGDPAASREWTMTRIRNYATPNTLRLVIYTPEGIYVLYNAFQPVAYNHTETFVQLARQYDKDPASDAKYYEFNHALKEEDRHVLEGQRPWLLPPIAARLQLYVRPADLPLIEYQRWMEQLGIPQI